MSTEHKSSYQLGNPLALGQAIDRSVHPSVAEEPHIDIEPVPCISHILSWFPGPCCIVNLAFGWVQVEPMEVVALLHMSTLTRIIDKPGCYKTNCFGRTDRRLHVSIQTADLKKTKVVDLKGNPIMVSALVNYRVRDAKLAMFNVDKCRSYVINNSTGVLKTVVGMRSYDDLKTHTAEVGVELAQALQPLVDCAGVEIISMTLNELNYAPEIASSMLKTQAASALVEARHIIVQGAVSIAQDAIAQLTADGTVKLTDEDKVKIVSNLLTVTCADNAAVPTVPLA